MLAKKMYRNKEKTKTEVWYSKNCTIMHERHNSGTCTDSTLGQVTVLPLSLSSNVSSDF